MIRFQLNEKEEKEAREFMNKHKPCLVPTTIGGGFSFIFSPTSVGYSVIIKCDICGETLNVTDYDSW